VRRVDKPWGHEIVWAETERYVAKVLFVSAGHRLSRQYHRVKDETLWLESGEIDLEIGEACAATTRRMRPGDVERIPPGTIHRMIAVSDARLFEVSTPELGDVVRVEDAYGREGTSDP
jgi:mannose-6-phosphate isomerase-like protein (cupin superfamily)